MKKQGTTMADPPWDKPNPAKRPKELTSAAKSSAKKAAKKAGRPYPNLVDNMHAAQRSTKKK